MIPCNINYCDSHTLIGFVTAVTDNVVSTSLSVRYFHIFMPLVLVKTMGPQGHLCLFVLATMTDVEQKFQTTAFKKLKMFCRHSLNIKCFIHVK
jgi:hypothetical protein